MHILIFFKLWKYQIWPLIYWYNLYSLAIDILYMWTCETYDRANGYRLMIFWLSKDSGCSKSFKIVFLLSSSHHMMILHWSRAHVFIDECFQVFLERPLRDAKLIVRIAKLVTVEHFAILLSLCHFSHQNIYNDYTPITNTIKLMKSITWSKSCLI